MASHHSHKQKEILFALDKRLDKDILDYIVPFAKARRMNSELRELIRLGIKVKQNPNLLVTNTQFVAQAAKAPIPPRMTIKEATEIESAMDLAVSAFGDFDDD